MPTKRKTAEAPAPSSENAGLPTRVNQSDLVMFMEAQRGADQAQGIFEFAKAHISRVYAIRPEDRVDLGTGMISRGVLPQK